MASEIRVDKINSLSGVGTVTLSPTGVDIAGITTAATLRATTGIVTTLTTNTLTANSTAKVGSGVTLSPDGDVFATGVCTATTFVGALTGTASANAVLTGSTDDTLVTVTGANAIQGESNLTFNGSTVEIGNNGSSYTLTGGSAKHEIGASGSDNDLVIQNNKTAVNATSNIIFKGSGSGGASVSEKVRISSTGQFSVGTTADVTGVSVAIGGSMRFVNATGQSATITALPSGTYNTGVSGGSAIVFHRISDSGGGSDEIAFETHHQGTRHGEAARFNKTGNLAFPSGQGIDFSATSDGGGTMSSELLDDYEEGTWTPNIRNDGTTNSWTGVSGRYVKIGQQVTVWFNADGGSSPRSGGTSSSLIMTGMPFSISMFGNPILGIIGANNSVSSGLYSTVGLVLNVFGQGGTQVRFGAGGQPINFGINYAAGSFTYTAA